ncbi:hypothetical protein MFUM_50017 [Methylacidiphilum fumariolicum SolV]|uniref:Uncharacterized protein n=2 Tax=Candidatus Methylacidiphilum fumarolicum TaxID=591154 RepID=I0JYA7_METFB|nr:conserved protein of unknown function [Candidatus Methylacidiphilum fumarolicum]CCG92226.1 hypothetical protein MFUM_50017 [Methylacidiphilum fumariolicum SolV]
MSYDQTVGLDRSELTPLEKETAARILRSNSHIRGSFLRGKRKPTLLKVEGGHNYIRDKQRN